jgi:aspartokinase-like uncharacterized kinase
VSTVVKLGGSLAAGATLRSWLAAIEHSRNHARYVLVPGGGGFADAVRGEQRRHGFSDRAAHRMALLAMEQYALMMADAAPWLALGESAGEIAAALSRGQPICWLPSRMVGSDPAIAESWRVTSDSLAAWLARRVDARRLILVKSAAPPRPAASPRRLAALGLVDPSFPSYAEGFAGEILCLGPGEEARLAGAPQPV